MIKKQEWKNVKGSWISLKPASPGVWRRKEGGFVVRVKATDPTTGRQKEIWKVLPDADLLAAKRWLLDEKERIRSGASSIASPKTRFAEFATSLFEEKVKSGDIRAASGRNKWFYTLKHLIGAFGPVYMDQLRAATVAAWRAERAALVHDGDYSPTTVNNWIAILRVIAKAAKNRLPGSHDWMAGIEYLDTSEHATYSEKEPNALRPDEVEPFVAKFREAYPQHFAMFYLGLLTGLRPSSLRPLRRAGDDPDVIWDQKRLRVRRSHTHGLEVMNTTKQKRRYTIDLPEEAMAILSWHVVTQLRTDEQRRSELLFPSEAGSFRTPKVLNAPLSEVAAELGLPRITQRGLRRTFNDLARAEQVSDLVTRSISGHLTEQMQHHYSTVNATEQRAALTKVARVLRLVPPPSTPGEDRGEGTTPPGEETKTG